MAYREFPPPAPWTGLIECRWTSSTAADAPPVTRDVLPDGCMDLIRDGASVLVAGPDTAPHPARLEPGTVVAGLRFAPGVLPGLLGMPASALRDHRVPLDELHPRLAGRAADLAGPDRHADEADLLGPLLGLVSDLPGDRNAPWASALAARIGTGAGVTETADALGWTTRTLHRHCLRAFGYGPSVLRRVLRFRRAGALLYAGIAPAEVAARTGYADQPHLSREVRALAGVAPGQLASGANRSTPVPSGSSTTA